MPIKGKTMDKLTQIQVIFYRNDKHVVDFEVFEQGNVKQKAKAFIEANRQHWICYQVILSFDLQ